MTSTELVRGEMRRFLRSSEPEAICVTGEWGVGKTFTWQTELDAARSKGELGLSRYSYASLFGIHSLEGLKLALFENLEFLDAPATGYADKGAGILKRVASKAAKYSQLAQGLPTVGQLLSKAGPLYFSAVRDQIVCIDDLERRGATLELKDVFGLISFLREQRGCKVILLLNEEELKADKTEFDTHFEKVFDARLIFSPTASEALNIAIRNDDRASKLLRGYCEILNIANIRVIKKIERLIGQVLPHLAKYSPEIAQQAIHSLVLFGWSKFQPTKAPPLDYFHVSSVARYLEQKHKTGAASENDKKAASENDKKWSALLSQYQFMNMDDFDAELMKFVNTGVLDVPSLAAKADEQNQKAEIQRKTGSLEKAWRPFHDSFNDNLDEVTKSILDGLKATIIVTSLSHLDAAVRVLYEIGKQKDTKKLLEFFVENKPLEFWDPTKDPFLRGTFHPEVAATIADRQRALSEVTSKAFNFEAELIQAAQTYNNEAIRKLANIPIDQYYRLIKAKEGDEMRRIIFSGLDFRRISNATPEMVEVVRRTEEALKRIASESTLNAARVARYGVSLDSSSEKSGT
jgi:hypothetical protein